MNCPLHAPARRGALTPLETGVLGCGTLALVFVVCCGVAVYYSVQNVRKGMSTDPAQIRGWLQAEVKCDPPKGYECLRGFQASAMGSTIGEILVGPAGAQPNERGEFDPSLTTFQLVKAPLAHQATPKDSGGRKETDTKDVVLTVSEKKAKGVRREVSKAALKRVEYQLPLRKTLTFLAEGPAESFDLKSMEDFLATMRLDQPFDLPTEVKDAPK